ncbi:hypothetical protein [Metallosphaera hakonensis]|nr:hypothetical protein [Metallosphaera hakonensis]
MLDTFSNLLHLHLGLESELSENHLPSISDKFSARDKRCLGQILTGTTA